jgi:SAM-dependent methyltransferase
MHVRCVAIVCAIVIAGSAGAFAQTPASDDAVWEDFVTWLDTMPPPTEVVSVVQLYSQALAGKGAGPEDVKRTIAHVLRLMRDRPDAWRPIFNRIYANADATFSREPTPLLVGAVEGRAPGRALDVGMGQGRNAVFLAVKGWDVVGFDLAEAGLEAARAQATRAGVSLQAVQADAATFDYGRDAWDLIVITYGPRFIAEGAFPDRLKAALRPGGLLVIESFASEQDAATRRPVDLDPADLLRVFQSYRLIRFEDVDAVSEWDPQLTRLVRLVAQKPSR